MSNGDPIRTFTLRYVQSVYDQFDQTRKCIGSQSWEGFFLALLRLVNEQADEIKSLKAEVKNLEQKGLDATEILKNVITYAATESEIDEGISLAIRALDQAEQKGAE